MFTTPKKDEYSVGAIESAMHILSGFKEYEIIGAMRLQFPNGRSEFYLRFIEIGNYLDECWKRGYEEYGAADGVFDYEVSAELGVYICYFLQSNILTDEKIKVTADHLLEKYFRDSRKYTTEIGLV